MKSATKKQPRRTIRLPGYDYSQARAYFITIVTHNRACIFGEIANGKMRLNRAGRIAHQEWQRVSQRFSNVQSDVFVVMPNHIHAILIIEPEAAAGAAQPAPAEGASVIDPMQTRLRRRRKRCPRRVNRRTPTAPVTAPWAPSSANSNRCSPDTCGPCPNYPKPPSGSAIITSTSSAPITTTTASRFTSRATRRPGRMMRKTPTDPDNLRAYPSPPGR